MRMLVFVLLASCTSSLPDAPRSGAHVKTSVTSVGVGTERTFEIRPGSDARLILALGDRISELDLTPAKPQEKQADALLAFAPLRANETARVRVRARPWQGSEILAELVRPLGGDVSEPDFVKRKMIEVTVDIDDQSVTRRIAVAPTDEPSMSTQFDVDSFVPLGAPVRLESWVMSAQADPFTPVVEMHGSALSATGKPLEALPAAVWTLWMQLEP